MLSRADLKPYQHRAVEWIKSHDACALWVFMGGGKTASTLTAISDLRASFDAHRALVIAPLRVARSVWSEEAATWDHLRHLRVVPCVGSEAERLAALKTPGDVHTINRENVKWLESLFIQGKKQIRHWPFDTVVLDESQSFRSQSSQRFKSINRLRRLFPRLIELTGTPSPKGLGNLWSQVKLLDGGERLGRTETDFRTRWFNRPEIGQHHWTIKGEWAEQEIYRKVSDIVLSLDERDYFTVEKPLSQLVKVQMTDAQRAVYRRMERTFVMETMSGKQVTAVSAGVLGGKLLQLANGAIYVDDQGHYDEFHTQKLDALVEILDGHDGPAMVCYSYRSDLPRMQKALAEAFGKDRTVEKLDSKASEDRWNRGETDVLLLHPASAGHGLNLQHSGAELIVWFGLTYDLELIQQANARLAGGHRRGQRPLVIKYLVADGTRDEDLLDAVLDLDNPKSKASGQERLMRAVARLNRG